MYRAGKGLGHRWVRKSRVKTKLPTQGCGLAANCLHVAGAGDLLPHVMGAHVSVPAGVQAEARMSSSQQEFSHPI